jgi:pimeloyl-ACP methyl ester carboxylesterase
MPLHRVLQGSRCRWLAALVGSCLLAACAQVPQQRYTSASTGTLAYALAGPQTLPVIVLQSGLGDGRSTWNTVWTQLAARHRLFALDRPGYGDSPSTSAPRDPCHAARDLHAALRDAQVPPPYLLVGHSLGGLYQVVFARLYPRETAGVLLLDPTHPEHWVTMQRDTPKTAALLSGLRSTVFTSTMRAEFDAQAQCLDALPPWPSEVPARLLFSGRFGPLETSDYQVTLARLRLDWQQRLGAPAETVSTSWHYLHRDAPERVVQALDRLLGAAAMPLRR